jgi:hypothetical protein
MALAYSTRVRQRFLLRTSTWSRAQKDSITALSKQSPTEPIDGSSPDWRGRQGHLAHHGYGREASSTV